MYRSRIYIPMRIDDSFDDERLERALYQARLHPLNAAHDDLTDQKQWAKLLHHLRLDLSTVPATRVASDNSLRRRKSGWMNRGAMISAAVLGIAAVCLLIFKPRFTADNESAPAMRYSTRAGERATVELANGATVTLAPLTSMSVAYHDRGTQVSVAGEAMFSVTHHDRSPFTVRIGNADARVLGTMFVVRKYATDLTTRVLVADGRISVQAHDSRAEAASMSGTHTLGARTLGIIDDSGHVSLTPNISVDDMTLLTRGRLVFTKTLLKDVIPELNRAYDVDIQVADTALASKPLTLTVRVDVQSLANVLDALSITLDAQTVRSGRVVTIVPGRKAERFFKSNVNPEKLYGR